MIDSVIFSPSGTSAKIAGILAGFLGDKTATYDLTVRNTDLSLLGNKERLAIFTVPVYAGRVPSVATERLKQACGNGQKVVAVVVYGNRDYDDALAELCDILESRNFEVIAAGAFIAQHCIFPKVAAGRPDAGDIDKISEFADLVRQKNGNGASLDIKTVKGNKPYKKAASVPLHPAADKKHCNRCGICARNCPTEAIDNTDPTKTDSARCITCCRCINICPQSARSLGGLLYRVAGWKFVRDNSRRLEPEWFI